MSFVTQITREGFQAALRNNPNRNGFRIEIGSIAVLSRGARKATVQVAGVSSRENQIILHAEVTSEREEYNYDEIHIIDSISGQVFAKTRRQDGGLIDSVTPHKSSYVVFQCALANLDDGTVTFTRNSDSVEMLKAMAVMIQSACINNLVTNEAQKPLSAAMGKKLNDEKLNVNKWKFSRPTVKSGSTEVNLDLSRRDSIIAFFDDDYIPFGCLHAVLHNTTETIHNIQGLPLNDRGSVQLEFNTMGAYSFIKCTYIYNGRQFYTKVNWNNPTFELSWIEILSSNNGVMLTGNQDILGKKSFKDILTAGDKNYWGKIEMPTRNGGVWSIESNPDSVISAGESLRFQIVFKEGRNTRKILFPSIGESNQEVAYKSWVTTEIAELSRTVKNYGNQDIRGYKKFLNTVSITGGAKILNTSGNEAATFGMGGGDIYISNHISNKYLQLKNSGELRYDDYKVLLSSDLSNSINLNDENKVATSKAVNVLRESTSVAANLLNLDLNNVRTVGIYGQPSHQSATRARNYPVESGGSLIVSASVYGVQQIYIPSNSGSIYKRNSSSSTAFHGWVKVNTTPEELRDSLREKANKATTRAGYGITDASQVAVLAGEIHHGGTIPLPAGFSESQCRWMVSMAQDDANMQAWDIYEATAAHNYYFRCFTRGRVVTAQSFHGQERDTPRSDHRWVNGIANYIIIGVK